jgi:hypothetical protein
LALARFHEFSATAAGAVGGHAGHPRGQLHVLDKLALNSIIFF